MNRLTRTVNIMKYKNNSTIMDLEAKPMSKQTIHIQMRKVVGYVRVSTKGQEKNGISLDAQSALLRDHAHKHNMDLVGISEDSQSAYDRRSSLRPGLQEALSTARSESIPVLVVSVDRLSRNMKDLALSGFSAVEIISVKEGKVGQKKLKKLVKAAEAASADAAQRSKDAVRSSASKGRGPGNRTNIKEAQRRGAVSNMLRSERKIKQLADFIAQNPSIKNLSWSGKVEVLNSAGHLNQLSEVHGETRTWTISALRKPFAAALAEIEMQEDMDREDAALISSVSGDGEGLVLLHHNASDAAGTPKNAAGAQVDGPACNAESKPPMQSAGISEGSAASPNGGADTTVSKIAAPRKQTGRGRLDPDDYPLPLRRRPLNRTEAALLRQIMKVRGLSESDVMDELGKPRLDASLWQSRSQGTTVSSDMLGRVLRWFGENRAVWKS